MTLCAECNAELPPGAAACPQCGTSSSSMQATGEYVTPRAPVPPQETVPVGTSTIEIGSLIVERYRILDRLGSGNMGSVYRAQDLSVGEDVALKFISPQCSADRDCADLLTKEVRISRLVSHPNVCRIHDLGSFDGTSFISMEYIDGEDLSSLLRRIGRIHGEKAHQIARQLCAGLQAAHERGVLHRDLKPANVMIDGEGNVRIADFGIAAAVGVDTGGGTRGTPAYMAPELFTGAPATVQSDLFSLGLVLYEVYTGHRLFEAESMTELLGLHRSAHPFDTGKVVGIDPEVEPVIRELLSRDPDGRPMSAMAALAKLPGGDPIAAALAYGETPSPELIADAGGSSTVSKRVALGMALFVLIGWILACWVGVEARIVTGANLPRSGDVLAQDALEMVEDLFAPTAAERRAKGGGWRFELNDAYLRDIELYDQRLDRWVRRMDLVRPALVDFWYRWNPSPVQPANVKGRIAWNDPPFDAPGMIRLRLDPEGRLQELQAIPKEIGAFRKPDATQTAPWPALFEAAGLDRTRFDAIEPEFLPATPFDVAAAFEGTYPDSGMKIRIEVAAFAGKPVRFLIVEDRNLGPTSGVLTPNPRYLPRQTTWRFPLLILLILVAAGMAWHSVSRHRGDLRGATWLGLATFALVIAFTLLTGDHNGQLMGFGQLLMKGMSHGLAVAGLQAMYYLALEPHVRRAWPETMTSWSRVLAGRFHDSLVGFHVLMGLVFGVGISLIHLIGPQVVRWSGLPEGPPISFPLAGIEALGGPVAALGSLLEVVIDSGGEGMKVWMALAVLSLLLRSRKAAAIASVVIFSWVFLPPASGATVWNILNHIGTLVAVAAFMYCLVRFGLVSMLVAMVIHSFLTGFPLTLEPSSWYSGNTLLSLLVVGGMTVSAYRCATRFAR